jgi:hypothetical protein
MWKKKLGAGFQFTDEETITHSYTEKYPKVTLDEDTKSL